MLNKRLLQVFSMFRFTLNSRNLVSWSKRNKSGNEKITWSSIEVNIFSFLSFLENAVEPSCVEKRNIENNWRSLMEHTQNQHIKATCSVLVCFALNAILFRPLWPTSGKTKLGHQNGSSFFRFHDHSVTLLLHYFLHDP